MKKLLIAILLLPFFCGAKTLYVSHNGNNTTGLSPTNAWTSLQKLNTMWGSVVAGDSVVFERGQTFNGFIRPLQNGDWLHRITLAAFGTGADPIISGLFTLDGWTANGTNKWICTPDSITLANCNILTINGVPQAVARTRWMKYYSLVAADANNASLRSPYLTGTPDWTGGEVVVRENTFLAAKGTISAQSTNRIDYDNNTQPIYDGRRQSFSNGTDSMGFFIQRHISAMDSAGEWFYNKVTNKFNLYSTVNPNTQIIKASYIDTLFILAARRYYKIIDIQFEGAGVYAIENYNGAALTIENCTFNNNTKPIYAWNTGDIRICNNTIDNSFEGGIFVRNRQAKRTMVDSNYIHNTGQLMGMGIYNNEFSLRALTAFTDSSRDNNFLYIIGNTIIKTGECPIYTNGSNLIVRRNVIDTFANQKDDMGGIYTFGANQNLITEINFNRIIDSNFISNAIGAIAGSRNNASIDVVGLYLDDQTDHITALHNTIWNIPGNGMQMNTPRDIWLRDNTVYNSSFIINENQKLWGLIQNIKITKNIFVQKTGNLLLMHVNDILNGSKSSTTTNYPAQTITQSIQNLGLIDSNWISNLVTNSYQSLTRPASGTGYTTTNINQSTWKSTYHHDQVSTSPLVTVTTSNTHLYVNPKNTDSVINFVGLRKQDMKGIVYNHTATIPKWSSLLLIDNGTVPNLPPSSDAGSDQSISGFTTTLSGSGVDPEGGAISSLWTKTAGPASGTITSSTSATTTVTGMVAGAYQFTYKATDPFGAFSSDVMNVIVTPVTNLPPSVDAGLDQDTRLPDNSVTVTADTLDVDGYIASISWLKLAGPVGDNIVSGSSKTTDITFTNTGTYNYSVTVTDDDGSSSVDYIIVNVLPAFVAPTVSTGGDILMQYPVDSALLIGIATDLDGTISTILWTKISGPVPGTIVTPDSLSTKIIGLIPGLYTYQFSVTDNDGLTSSTTINVNVLQPTTKKVSVVGYKVHKSTPLP